MEEYNHIWDQVDKYKKKDNDLNFLQINSKQCSNCNIKNLHTLECELICHDCGLVIDSYKLIGGEYISTEIPTKYTPHNANNNTIQRLQQWTMYSNEEKSQYKLKKYTEQLCEKIDIDKTIISIVSNTVIEVMEIIKENDGAKRARVKDGIIIICIQYVSRYLNKNYDSVSLAKKMDLNIKYITKAEKIMLPLLNSNKIKFDKTHFLQTEQPFFFVEQIIQKYNLDIPKNIIIQVREVIDICNKLDILLDHTPQSIGICSFYFILKLNNVDLDIKLFIEIYNISLVTLLKTFNKLENYKPLFAKHNIIPL